MKGNTVAVTILVASLWAGSAWAQAASSEAQPKTGEVKTDANAAPPDLSGYNFAVGIGALYLVNKAPDILGTTIDNGVLRITNQEQYKLGFWLSTNLFFNAKPWGIQPGAFFAVQMGSGSNTDTLNSMAVGLALTSASTSASKGAAGNAPLVFQVGYGLTHIQTLASGYANGMTMPANTNQPVFIKTIGRGPVVIVSTTFR